MLSMASEQENQFVGYKLLINNDEQGELHIYTDNTRKSAKRKSIICMLVGAITGLFLTQIFILSFEKVSSYYEYNKISIDQDRQPPYRIPEKLDINFGSHFHENEDTAIADQLFSEVRVLCWVMTVPQHHGDEAKTIKKTWGSRCSKLIFMSSEENTDLGSVNLLLPDGSNNLWAKTKEAFKYIYEHHLDEYDWFMQTDDTTYVIVENLRRILYKYSTDIPIYLGCKYEAKGSQEYMANGAGYVLSKEALKRFVEKALPDATKCHQDKDESADIVLGKCMKNVGVLAGDSRDEYERGRMFPFPPEYHLTRASTDNSSESYLKNIYYKSDKLQGLNCCSDHAISFHNISPRDMYVLDYFTYHLRPFGITPTKDELPDKTSLEEIINVLSFSRNRTSPVEVNK